VSPVLSCAAAVSALKVKLPDEALAADSWPMISETPLAVLPSQ
jgi:hypothetical protein